ncbi:MAG: RluA family pseudouridine synthase [Lentisphaerae bacterium]|nr:MAG: RluA family pseudouridine synthase [Lentisphaerota bacterium]
MPPSKKQRPPEKKAIPLRRICRTPFSESRECPLTEWLSARFTYHDQDEWEHLIRSGRVLVDGKPGHCGTILRKGAVVEYLPEEQQEPAVDFNWTILEQGNGWLAINKPPDLPCHPGGRYFRNTLWAELYARFGKVHFIHRLDRETSGIVLVALNPETAGRLGKIIEAGRLRKEYLVLVEGEFPARLTARGWLCRDTASSVRKKLRFVELQPDLEPEDDATMCETYFERVDCCGGLSCLRAILKTGRTHQIRATLQSLGYPLVGDKLYGFDPDCFLRFIRGELSEEDQMRLGMKHQALHAWRLSWEGPDSDHLTAPLPASWFTFLRSRGCEGLADSLDRKMRSAR